MSLSPHCLNCGHQCDSEDIFCPSCGQKRDENELTVRSFVRNILSAIINYDSSLWKTLRDVFIPGKLTNNYIRGQRKAYLNPVRFFIIMAIINLLISGTSQQFGLQTDLETGSDWLQKEAFENEIIDRLDLIGLDSFPSDSIRNLYYTLTSINRNDSFNIQDPIQEPFKLDSLSINFGIEDFRLTSKDIAIDYRDISLNFKEIIDKYEIHQKWDQLIMGQTIKLVTQSDSFGAYISSKISWMFFILIPLQGLSMMIFYRKRTYVEHLIYLLHIHTLAFLMLIIIKIFLLVMGGVEANESILAAVIFLAIAGLFIYSFIAGQRVYRQKWYWTLLKLYPLSITYFIFLLTALLIVVIIGAAIF